MNPAIKPPTTMPIKAPVENPTNVHIIITQKL